jgi:hypothetical protein
MRGAIAIMMLLALGACGENPERKRAADEADIAAVEAAQGRLPPLQALEPELLETEDLGRMDIGGAGCTIRLERDPARPLFVAAKALGWMKRDGELIKLAADTGSTQSPGLTWSRYTGRELTVRIESIQLSASPDMAPVTVTIRDAYDRVIFRAAATRQCRQ